MTAESKQSTAKSSTASRRRGKRIGPTNLEAKRAEALRQAAAAAETERQATALASTVSLLQLLKDAALTGTIPSNPQLFATINSWRNSPALSPEGLSPTGKRLVEDVKGLTDLLAEFLKERNGDELLQRFLHHVHLASKIAGVDIAIAGWRARGKQRRQQGRLQAGGQGKISIWKSRDNRQQVFVGGEHSRITGIDTPTQTATPGELETRKQQQKVAKDARALLRIAQQLIISADFRNLLNRLQRISRRVINLAKESEIETGAESETYQVEEFEQESLEYRGISWEKDIEHVENDPGCQPEESEHQIDQELRRLERDEAITYSHLHNVHSIGEGGFVSGISSGVQSRDSTFPETIGRTHEDIPIPSMETARNLPIMEPSSSSAAAAAAGPSSRKTSKISKSISAKRIEILNDLRQVFTELSANSQFSRALRDFYTVLLKMRRGATSLIPSEAMTTTSAPLVDDLRFDANFRAAQDELLVILERLSGSPGVSLNPLIENLRKVRRETQNDYELRDFLGDWRAFLKRCTGSDSPRYLESEEYLRRGESLLKRTEAYFSPSGQYRSHLDEAFEALNRFTDGLRSDRLTRDLGRHVAKLVREDLIGIGRGEKLSLRSMLTSSALLRPDLLNDFRYHILPRILHSMKSIPLPRIEVISGGTLLVLEDLIVPTEALVPMQMEILTSSHVTMNPKSRLFRRAPTPVPKSSARMEGIEGGVQLNLTSIAGQVRNVRFTMDRHEGWPRFSDQGLADLRISGRGLSIFVDLASHPASEISGKSDLRSSVLPAALIANHVRVRIDRLTLTLHDSLHDSMYRIFNPILSSVVKRNMERAIRDQILNVVDSLDGLLDRLSQSVIS